MSKGDRHYVAGTAFLVAGAATSNIWLLGVAVIFGLLFEYYDYKEGRDR